MKITINRISRYLVQVKRIVGYCLKMKDAKDRETLYRITKVSMNLFDAEKELRSLQQYLVNKGKNG